MYLLADLFAYMHHSLCVCVSCVGAGLILFLLLPSLPLFSLSLRVADACAELMEVNHDEEVVDTERFNISQEMEEVTLDSMQPAEQEVAKRLTTPVVNTYLDTKDIAFERSLSFFLVLCMTVLI